MPRTASAATIKAACRRLPVLQHPDRNGGSAQAKARFQEINAANQILSDPEKRRQYDRFGMAAFKQPGQWTPADWSDRFTDIFGPFFGSEVNA